MVDNLDDGQTVFEKAMNSPVAQNQRRVAAIVIFPRGTTEEMALEALDLLNTESVKVQEFDPTLGGSPTLYFP